MGGVLFTDEALLSVLNLIMNEDYGSEAIRNLVTSYGKINVIELVVILSRL
jgi:hypothetical protein